MWTRRARRPWSRSVELPARLHSFGPAFFTQRFAFSPSALGFHLSRTVGVWVTCFTFGGISTGILVD